MEDRSMTTQEELPALATSGRANPYAVCTTEGCFGTKMPVVALDYPPDVVAWNRRSAASAEPAVAEEWSDYIDQLNVMCEDFGCEPGADRLQWLHERLSSLAAPPSPVVSEDMVRALQVAVHTLTAIRELCDKNRIDAMLNKVSAAGVDVAIIRARAALNAALSPAPAGEVGWRTVPVEPTEEMV
jgi:hypothetical protein